MEDGKVSQTAIKVALIMLTLSAKRGWRKRLPEELAPLTEKLLLSAGIPWLGPRLIRANKRPWAVMLSEMAETAMPGTFEGMGERKLFINGQVLDALHAGARQVLVVGAGFDTLCLRLATIYPDVRFIELDHPATSAAKARGIEAVGKPDNLTQIAADLRTVSVAEVLARQGDWDPEEQAVAIAEGLFLYLRPEDIHSLFASIGHCTGPHSRVVFSYGITVDQHRLAKLFLNMIGEPWLSSSTEADLPDYIGPGWHIIAMDRPGAKRDLEGFAVAEKD